MINFDSKDKILGLGFVIVAVVLATIGAIWFVSAGSAVPFSFMAAMGTLFFVGILLIVTDWMENEFEIMDEIEAFPHAFSFHWEELRQSRPTRAMYMWGGTIFLILLSAYLIFKYDKWTHVLFLNTSAVVVGLIISLILAWVFIKTLWFQTRLHETPSWWFWAAAIGLLLAAGLGIYFTEPVEYGGPSQWEIDARGRPYDYTRTRIYYSHFFTSSSSSSSSSGFSFDCDEDICVGLIIIAIIVIVVIASATTPHFWVAAVMILSMLLIIISLREIYYPITDDMLKEKPKETAVDST